MEEKLHALLEHANATIAEVQDLKSLDEVRVQYLGKKGELTELLRDLQSLPVEQRPQAGKALNILKEKIQESLDARRNLLQQQIMAADLAKESIDITLPGTGQSIGHIHPISRVRHRVETLFQAMGFNVVEGPEIEDDYHNF